MSKPIYFDAYYCWQLKNLIGIGKIGQQSQRKGYCRWFIYWKIHLNEARNTVAAIICQMTIGLDSSPGKPITTFFFGYSYCDCVVYCYFPSVLLTKSSLPSSSKIWPSSHETTFVLQDETKTRVSSCKSFEKLTMAAWTSCEFWQPFVKHTVQQQCRNLTKLCLWAQASKLCC